MTSEPPVPEPGESDGDAPPGVPRWVQVSGIVAGVVVVSVIALLLIGGHRPGAHGLGHLSSGSSSRIGAPAAADKATRTVRVSSLDTMAFDPGRITVAAGETVTFEVTNAGKTAHEFILGEAGMQQEHGRTMAQMPGMAHDTAGSLRLQPGETKRLTWKFGDAGTLEYGCQEPGHYEAGMRGQIVVS